MTAAPERTSGEEAEASLLRETDPAVRRHRILTAAVIFLVVTTVIVITARGPGLTWDEAIYCGYSAGYVSWFESLSAEAFRADVIERVWHGSQVHPPLGKLWIAAFFKVFEYHHDIIAVARMSAAVLFGLCAAVIYLSCAERRGDVAGLVAAGVFVLMPRIFGHGHFANLEMLMALLWLATILAFDRGIRSRGWSVACGVLFGLALLTKINAVFLPIVLAPWGLIFHGRKAWRNLILMAIIGPLMFLGGWPAMWHDPVTRAWEYLADKASRAAIPTYYLGRSYSTSCAPFHYPFVMLLATTPLPVILAGAAGVSRCVKTVRAAWRDAGYEVLLLAGFAFPVLLLAVPGVPRYDGIRLMLPAYPFLALLAADGTLWAWEKFRSRFQYPVRAARRIAVLLAFWLLLPIVAFHPFHLCYYNELVGGPWGARKLGFETTYWNETFDGAALDYLNKHVPANGRVALEAVGSMVWQYYGLMGEVRGDIGVVDFNSGDWDYLVVVSRQGYLAENSPGAKAFTEKHAPVWTNGLPPFGQPAVCHIYKRP